MLARTAALHSPLLEDLLCQYRGILCAKTPYAIPTSNSTSLQQHVRHAVAAAHHGLAKGQDHAFLNSGQGPTPGGTSNASADVLNRKKPQPDKEQQRPVQLSEAIRALDFDWEDHRTDESHESGSEQRTESGMSASSSTNRGAGNSKRRNGLPHGGHQPGWLALWTHPFNAIASVRCCHELGFQ